MELYKQSYPQETALAWLIFFQVENKDVHVEEATPYRAQRRRAAPDGRLACSAPWNVEGRVAA